jgi:hypothetical protein
MQLGLRDNADFRMTVSQPLFTGFRLIYRRKMARALENGKRLEEAQKRNELVLKVETAYGLALKAAKISKSRKAARQARRTDAGVSDRAREKDNAWRRKSGARRIWPPQANGVAACAASKRNRRKSPADIERSAETMHGNQSAASQKKPSVAEIAATRAAAKQMRLAGPAACSIDRGSEAWYGKPGSISRHGMDGLLGGGGGCRMNLWSWGRPVHRCVWRTEIAGLSEPARSRRSRAQRHADPAGTG